jgi:hypothetical protein
MQVFAALLVLMVPIVIILAFIWGREWAGRMDRDRVRAYIAERGGEVVSQEWTPFAAGWFGNRDERMYRVVYRDSKGYMREATCKTSMLGGVYFTNDRLLADGRAVSEPSDAARDSHG